MTRKKIKLEWVVNENSRTTSLKKRRLGLVKKVSELTILCDVKACLIIFSPDKAEPMVWPSVEAARDLLEDFFALPNIEKKKRDMSLESYLEKKTSKAQNDLRKTQKKNMEYVVDQLMMQLQLGRSIDDLNVSEISGLLSFTKEKIMHYRKRLDLAQHRSPLRDPLMHFDAQFKELRTTTNDVSMTRDGQDNDERAKKTDETTTRINIGAAVRENQSPYLVDQWVFPFPEPLDSQIHKENPNLKSYLPSQGSGSNGIPNMETESIGSPVMTFHGLVDQTISQRHHMNNEPMMAMSQPRQHSFDFMSREVEVREDMSNINNGDSLASLSSNTMTTNDGLHQDPSSNEARVEEGKVDDMVSFDINMVWPGTN